MRLHGAVEGTVYTTDGRDVYVGTRAGRTFAGRLPTVGTVRQRSIAVVLTSEPFRSVIGLFVGAVPTVNLWPLSRDTLIATVRQGVFRSNDGGRTWEHCLDLPSSSGSMGILPSGVTNANGMTYLGEYPLDPDVTPRILGSPDEGRTWSTHATLPDVRHVHAVTRDPYTDEVWVTTGDTDAESRIGRLQDGTLSPVGQGSQRWRAVDLVFTPSAILWGMDCHYADETYIFKLPRTAVEDSDPEPEPVFSVPGSVYYGVAFDVDGERWVAFSTAMEVGTDSTKPDSGSSTTDRGVVVASSSASDFTEWIEVHSFERRRRANEYLPLDPLPANGYVFLTWDPDLGLLINPFNTKSTHGTVRQIPPSRFGSHGSPTSSGTVGEDYSPVPL